jgi:carbonic anhydrase
VFDDLLEANRRYSAAFRDAGLAGRAARNLAVVTCIDSRIDPLAMLGLVPGDATILRNAGARVTPDALRSLVLATNLLAVKRVCLVQHTDCAMAGSTDHEIRTRIEKLRGADASAWNFLAMNDQQEALAADVALLRSCTLLPPDLEIGAFIFDVHTGELQPVPIDS